MEIDKYFYESLENKKEAIKSIEGDKIITPLACVQIGDTWQIINFIFSSDEDKENAIKGLFELVKQSKSGTYFIIQEIWLSKAVNKEELDKNPRPRDDPNRKSGLMALYVTPSATKQILIPFGRTESNKVLFDEVMEREEESSKINSIYNYYFQKEIEG